jgi:hypothetical protein
MVMLLFMQLQWEALIAMNGSLDIKIKSAPANFGIT